MARETKKAEAHELTRRQRIRLVVESLIRIESELVTLRDEIEPRSVSAHTLIRENLDLISRARLSLHNYLDEIEAWV